MTEEALFELAVNVADAERAALLDRECAGNPELRARIEALLRADGRTHAFDSNAATGTFGPSGASTGSFHPTVGEAGQVIAGKYTLLEVVGEGGMGSVWRAKQTEPVKRHVAVKLIKAGMDSKAVLARFDAERQALAMMDHPNIAKILDGGLHENRPYFVMELVKGTPITEFCDKLKLTPQQRLELFLPVCQAIQHAHQKGIIHRDIKPSNVLIALYDDKPVPKVIDFGVAKATGGALTESTIDTGFGGIVGTPQYMSPEQATFNNLDIDTRSDVYSLGVLLYELLAGSPPFAKKELEKRGLLEILRVVREEEPPRPSTKLSTADALPSLSASRSTEPKKLTGLLKNELDWIVMKALEKDRSRRYETANGFAADVNRYLSGEAVLAHPPSTAYRVKKFVRRHKGRVLAASLLFAALVGGLASTTWQAIRATRAEELALDEQTKTANALTVAEQKRQEADEQREKAETQAASIAVDIDLKYCEDGETALGLLRMAQTLQAIPEHARELREYTALNILAWGQRLQPLIGTLDHDGYHADSAEFSPDGLTILTIHRDGTARLWDSLTGKVRDHEKATVGGGLFSPNGSTVATSGSDGTIRLWDTSSGKQRLILDERVPRLPGTDTPRLLHFSKDGQKVLTEHSAVDKVGANLIARRSSAVRIWDAKTGLLQATLSDGTESIVGIQVSDDGSRVLTVHTKSLPRSQSFAPQSSAPLDPKGVYYWINVWNGATGQLIRKLEIPGLTEGAGEQFFVLSDGQIYFSDRDIKISPDGRSVLIDRLGQFEVWLPEEGGSPQRLPGQVPPIPSPQLQGPGGSPGGLLGVLHSFAFSPKGRYAVTASNVVNTPNQKVRWWDTDGWQLLHEYTTTAQLNGKVVFVQEDIFVLERSIFFGTDIDRHLVFLKRSPEAILAKSNSSPRSSPDGNVVAFDGDEAYDARTGKRLLLSRGHRFLPELRSLSEDHRYLLFPNTCIADLAVEKRISFNADGRYLSKQEAWVGLDAEKRIVLLRKSDAALDAGLLQKWCQVLTRGKLDDSGRFSKLEEAAWEQLRQELARELDANPAAQVLRSATADRLYWLRAEIAESKAPLPLHDRLVAAEPTWTNYRNRAKLHFDQEHWDLAIRDEFEAARLTGERYWTLGTPLTDWTLGARLVQAPGRPREQYELALKWAEARLRAGVNDYSPLGPGSSVPYQVHPSESPKIIGLAQYRLGRYSDALATLAKQDKPLIADASAILMSPWNELIFAEGFGSGMHGGGMPGGGMHGGLPGLPPGGPLPGIFPRGNLLWFYFDPSDLSVRAMCHHQMGKTKEAALCLRMTRRILSKEAEIAADIARSVGSAMPVGSSEQWALLREAETLIEGNKK